MVGGGAIGLAAALALADTGRKVTVLERGRPGEEATRAAAGMLSPLGEATGPGPMLRIGLDSLARWPAYAARLSEETGLDLTLRMDGRLWVALDRTAAERLERHRAWVSAQGLGARWLSGVELSEREPALTHRAMAGLHLDGDGQVDNRALAEAIRRATERAGC